MRPVRIGQPDRIELFCSGQIDEKMRDLLCDQHQDHWEFPIFINFLKWHFGKPIKYILELGVAGAGTLKAFTHLLADKDAVICGVDRDGWDNEVKSFETQAVHMIKGNTDDPKVMEQVYKIFPNGVDLLFIDADHRAEAVKKDWNNYTHLVRNQGVVGLHDIMLMDQGEAVLHSTPLIWPDIKRNNFNGTMEISNFCGIGIVVNLHNRGINPVG